MRRINGAGMAVCLMVITCCLFVVSVRVWAGPIEDSAAITQKWVKGLHDGDGEAMAALYATDGVYTSWTYPEATVGREAIKKLFSGGSKALAIRQFVLRDEIRKAYGDLVVFSCNWTFTFGDGKGPTKSVQGRMASVDTIVDGKRMIVLMTTSLLPAKLVELPPQGTDRYQQVR